MKRTLVLFAAVLLFLTGCSGKYLEKPETDLEFWITDNVENVDFSKYQEKYGLMGGREYYGSGYVPTTDENGEQRDPEHCVIYTVTSYPDYSSGKSHITRISITDPEVSVYGVTLTSSAEDIKNALTEAGFSVTEKNGGVIGEKGRFRISFSSDSIYIHADVSNRFGIQF